MKGASEEKAFAHLRARMVAHQIEARGIHNPKVLDALRKIPRHFFVTPAFRSEAYQDNPLPIGHGQTISQPYIVALMTDLLDVHRTDKVLEIGTGSGYQAAVLGELVAEVFSVELCKELAGQSADLLKKLGYGNVHVMHADGNLGWIEQAPYDRIIVTAAPAQLPKQLLEQLRQGGRLVAPVGSYFQELSIVDKTAQGLEEHRSIAVRFVPMLGTSDPSEA